jgi:hypothetical protein
MQSEDEPQYHNASGYVHAGCFAFEHCVVWSGVDSAEAEGFALTEIAAALSYNRDAAVVALALRNIATLRALIDEAGS